MALIPYDDYPGEAAEPGQPGKKDPPLMIAGHAVKEFYCGDDRCDCATGHLIVAGVPMSVDLGTTRVELVNQQDNSPSREALCQTVRGALQQGAIGQLRNHYAKVREWGRDVHFAYVDWSGVKAGQLVGWQQVYRHQGLPLFAMTTTPTAGNKGAEAPADKDNDKDKDAPEKPQFYVGLADAYCIEPRCDCNRVAWTVVTAPSPESTDLRTIGTVEYSFATQEPAVKQTAAGVQANQLFMIIHGLLKGQPELHTIYANRYAHMRQMMTPILQQQRRAKSEAHRQPSAGRNDPCPCGSGKKFKKCHG